MHFMSFNLSTNISQRGSSFFQVVIKLTRQFSGLNFFICISFGLNKKIRFYINTLRLFESVEK